MAKRKHDCSLDGIVIEYYRRSKCKKTLKSLEKQNRNNCSKSMYDDFVSYLRKSKAKTENYNDDLGFEINFGAFQPQPKVVFFCVPSVHDCTVHLCSVPNSKFGPKDKK